VTETATPGTRSARLVRRGRGLLRRRRVGFGALVAVAGLVGFLLWVTIGQSGGDSQSTSNGSRPVPVSAAGLATLAGAVPTPIYWAGPLPGKTYELTQTTNGRVYVRYLPPGVKIGTSAPYLTIATYPAANAFATTQRAARQVGAVPIEVGAGAVAFYNESRPQSVFFAQSGSSYQVEVYDPSAARAQGIVAARMIEAVRGTAATSPHAARAVSEGDLRRLAISLRQPIYWLGPKSGYTYELTQTTNGRVFVRYLPPGAKVGADKPYLTVATYPYQGAFAGVQALARASSRPAIKLAGNGLGVVDTSYPESIHVAFPGTSYEIEVFDPSPAETLRAVESGDLQVVR
jgi:hypothetical protein